MNQDPIHRHYSTLLEHLADISLAKAVANEAFKRELHILNEAEKNESPDTIIGSYAFGFENPFTGETKKYAIRRTSISNIKLLTLKQKNYQYCWLLSNAFEKFEHYLKQIYSIVTGQKAPRKLNTLLAHFSDKYPNLKHSEENNEFQIHLKIAVLLVEKLRHYIVHEQGIVSDIEKFTSKIINHSGINNNKLIHKQFILQFIFDSEVYIVERPIPDSDPGYLHIDLFNKLVNYLIAYAYLIKEST